MPYKKFVEVGRVAYNAFGSDKGKLCTIVDVIDENRVLVDGPAIKRIAKNIKCLHLTTFVVPVSHSARTGTVRKAWAKAEIDQKWSQTTWAKKLANREKRAALSDYERFKVMKLKQTKSRLVSAMVSKSKKAALAAKKK